MATTTEILHTITQAENALADAKNAVGRRNYVDAHGHLDAAASRAARAALACGNPESDETEVNL